ncbi:MAG TPA: hypothetical protein VGN26_14075 [Armatimonadota bacterium]
MAHSERFPTFRAMAASGRRLRGPTFRGLWRRRRGIGLAAVVAFIVVLGWAMVLGSVSGRRYEAELAAIRRRGEPLTLAEAAPRPVPNSQNAALLYIKAARLLPRDSRWREDFLTLRRVQPPHPLGPAPILAAVAKGAEPAVAVLREAARRERCVFPWWSASQDGRTLSLESLNLLAPLLRVHGEARAQSGDPQAGWKDLAAIVGLARHLNQDPTSLSQTGSLVALRMARKLLPSLLASGTLLGGGSRRIDRTLSELNPEGMGYRAVLTERCAWLQSFELARGGTVAPLWSHAGPGHLGWLGGGEQSEHPSWQASTLRWFAGTFPPLRQALVAGEGAAYLQSWARTVEFSRGSGPPWDASDSIPTPRWSPWRPLLCGDAPYGMSNRSLAALSTAYAAEMRWALALARYRHQRGTYPSSLDQAAPLLGGAPPLDPFSGKSLRYHREGDGYLLYSVGRNGRDDGGVQDAFPRGGQPSRREQRDDISFRVPA